MTKLIYPTIDIFLYDLRKGLGQTEKEVALNRKNFWRKYVNQIGLDDQQLTKLEKREKEDADYVELGKFRLEPELDGYYYALQLNDTYSLQIDCSGKKRTEEEQNIPESIETLSEIKSQIEIAANQTATIGKTWLIWGQLTDREQDLQKVAEECYQKVAPEKFSKAIIFDRSNLLGGDLFEFWQHPSLDNEYHLLVWLFPPEEDLQNIKKKVSKLYYDLIRLFYYRHKVTWAYRESRKIKELLTPKYASIYQSITHINQVIESHNYDLDFLRNSLTSNLEKISEYNEQLNRLNAQDITIKVNLENYRKRLKKITGKDAGNQSDLLTKFIEYAEEKYQQEVAINYSYLSPGITLLENTIKTIEGIINLEQAQSDRDLSRVVAIASIGLGISSVTATVISGTPPSADKQPIYFYTSHILFSLVLGLLSGYILWQIFRPKSKKKD